jgi:hypothetical protein
MVRITVPDYVLACRNERTGDASMYVIRFRANGAWHEIDPEIFDNAKDAVRAAKDTVDQTVGLEGWEVLDADKYTSGVRIAFCRVAYGSHQETD